MRDTIRTTTDLMKAAAECLRNGDLLGLDCLRTTACQWLQTDDERDAQIAMLDAMSDAIEDAN